MEKKRILVTGGAGYLGSVLCRKLIENGYEVVVLDKLLYGDNGIKDLYDDPNFWFKYGDTRNISSIMDSLDKVHAVIHLAAIVNDISSKLYPVKTLEINYISTKLLIELCRYCGVGRFISASTCSVYGASSSEELLTETSAINPVSLYGKTKLASEKAVLQKINDNKLCSTVLRMATLHGISPRMRFDLAVNIMTAQAKYENKYDVFGGNQWRAFCHIEDAATAYIKCLEAPIKSIDKKIINICTENMTILELGKKIHDIVPNSKLNVDEKNIDIRNYKVSNKMMEKLLQLKSTKSVEDSVREIYDKDYSDFRAPIYYNYEVLKRKGLD